MLSNISYYFSRGENPAECCTQIPEVVYFYGRVLAAGVLGLLYQIRRVVYRIILRKRE